MPPRLIVKVVGDTKEFEKALGRASRQADSFSSKIGRALKVGVFAGATAGVVGLTAALKVGIDEFRESERVAAQTAAALKSTGGAANISAKQIERLATQLQNLSGADDEAIQSAENLLLTFTKIRNEVGRGNDIFNQATLAVLNLSTRMDKDLGSSAVLVGKALNAPVAGLTALTRAGVQFTDQQKNLIKRLVETDRQMEAQKVILAELETQFGSSARAAGQTLGGQLNILKNNLSEVAGEIVAKLAPAVERVVRKFNRWITNTENQAELLEDISTVASDTAAIFQALAAAVERTNAAFRDMKKARGSVKEALGPFGFLLDTLPSAIRGQIKRGVFLAEAFGLIDKPSGILGPQGPAGAIKAGRDALFSPRPAGLLGPTTGREFKRVGEQAGKATAKGFQIGLQSGGFGGFAGIGLRGGRAQNALLSGLGLPSGAFNTGRVGALAKLIQQRQFSALGLTATGENLAPTRQALQAQVQKIQASLKGTILDTSSNRNMLARVRKVLSLQFGALTRETRLAIDRLLGVFDDLEKKADSGFRKINADQFLRGSGLSGEALKAARAALSRVSVGPGGNLVAPGRGIGAFGIATPVGGTRGGVLITGPVTVVANSPEEFERGIQKKAGRTAAQRRGVRPAVNRGLQ